MGRARFFIWRTVQMVFLLWLSISFLFVLFRLMPGDFASIMLYEGVSPEQVAEFEREWGLNDPLHVQYINYMTNLLQGNFGVSLTTRQPVLEFVGLKFFNSLILLVPGVILGYIFGSALGTLIGTKRGTWIERAGVILALFLGSLPSFVIAIVMVLVFSLTFDIFPSSGMLSAGSSLQAQGAAWWQPYLTQDFLMHYILPLSTVSLRYTNLPTLVMRTSIIEVTNQDFVYYNRIVGLGRNARLKHLARHASLPVITLFPISIAQGIGGLVLIEVVFNWPGIGQAFVQSILSRNLPVLQFIFFIIAVLILVGNFLVDLAYGIVDPRISVGD